MIVKVLHSNKLFQRWTSPGLIAAVLLLTAGVPAAWTESSSGASKQAVIAVKGLACPFCVYGLKKHLATLPGAKHVEANLGKGQAVVDFAPDAEVTEQQIQKAVRDAGFTAGKIEWRTAGKAGGADEKPTGTAAKPAGSSRSETTADFAIEGIRCTYCAANITTSLQKLAGVKSAQVDFQKKIASVTYDASKTSPQEIIRTIEQVGKFRATLKSGGNA